ncbi:MAG: hypothetical protein R6X33_05905 [Candidatus Brocadiia bacterium]
MSMHRTIVTLLLVAIVLLALVGCHPHHWPHHVGAETPVAETSLD